MVAPELAIGLAQEVEHRGVEEPPHDRAAEDREECDHDAPAELLEVLHHRHRAGALSLRPLQEARDQPHAVGLTRRGRSRRAALVGRRCRRAGRRRVPALSGARRCRMPARPPGQPGPGVASRRCVRTRAWCVVAECRAHVGRALQVGRGAAELGGRLLEVVAHARVDQILDLVLHLAELTQPLADRAAELGQALRAHDHEGDDEDEQQFRRSDVEHVIWRAGARTPILSPGAEPGGPVARAGALGRRSPARSGRARPASAGPCAPARAGGGSTRAGTRGRRRSRRCRR